MIRQEKSQKGWGGGVGKDPIQLISIFLETIGIRHNGAETTCLITNISINYILFQLIENHNAGHIYSALTRCKVLC